MRRFNNSFINGKDKICYNERVTNAEMEWERGGLQMKIRTRLAIAFLTITVLPITLIYMVISMLSDYQGKMFSESHGLTEQVDLSSLVEYLQWRSIV